MTTRPRIVGLALVSAGLLAGWVAPGSADLLPPVPPVPRVPPVQIPTLPQLPPPPEVPQGPPPRVAPAPPVSHPVPTTGSDLRSAAEPSASSSPQASATSYSSGPTAARPAKVSRPRFSRDWIARTGPKRRRQTTLSFILRRPALVEFVVLQIAPRCLQMGRFRVQGRAGLNRVRFSGRVGRRMLGPGTYRIRARTRRGSRIADIRLVIVGRANQEEIKAARRADTCTSAMAGDASAASRPGPVSAGKAASGGAPAGGKTEQTSGPAPRHAVLGARFTKVVKAVKRIPPTLYVLLAFAIALLVLASLPARVIPNGRAAAVLAQNRFIFVTAGAVALLATMIAYTMG